MAQEERVRPTRGERLQAFSGRVLTGICFESGHSLWLYDFESTPTDLGDYRELWVVEPDDTRILYYDTEGADREVARFHDADRSVLAEMEWVWTDDRIDIRVEDSDGTTIELAGDVGTSVMSRLLTLGQRYLPGPLHERFFGAHTETGRFGHLRSRRVDVVTEATARINGTSLGAVQPPPRPITFGEVSAERQPLVFVGDLLLEYPAE